MNESRESVRRGDFECGPLQRLRSGSCRRSGDARGAAPHGLGLAERTEGGQLISTGVEPRAFSASWKVLTSRILFDDC